MKDVAAVAGKVVSYVFMIPSSMNLPISYEMQQRERNYTVY